MIEWQSEASLFTLRIRGRQWYWIYKYDLKTITDLVSVPKNVGHNRWQIVTPNELQVSDDYLHILQLRIHNKWIKRYWTEFLEKTTKESNFNVISALETPKVKLNKPTPFNLLNDVESNFNDELDESIIVNTIAENYLSFRNSFFKKTKEECLEASINENAIYSDELFDINAKSNTFINNTYTNFLKNNFNNEISFPLNSYIYNHENFIEVSRWTKRTQGTISPCRLIKYPVTNQLNYKNTSNSNDLELFRFRFNDSQSKLVHKPVSHNNYLVIKQKRYKPLKTVPLRTKYVRDPLTGKNTKTAKYTGKMTLVQNSIFIEDEFSSTLRYKLFKKFKKQTESIPLTLWKRLLRTKRTLVLPAHINITTITNSYDVVHSWFIPGLGIKVDCIPGRATHHVLHIDNVGFYYGQCAEICGRYHHHMPIRVCALPFEHFLVWWHTFGVSKLMYMGTDQRRYTKDYALRKYIW